MSIIALRDVTKHYGQVKVLHGIDLEINAGEVTCILGDNGAGKSTLIKILAGRHQHTGGELLVDGNPVKFTSPQDALQAGIATVYQDLAVVGQMPVWRNFFLGQEITGKFGILKTAQMRQITLDQLSMMGIELPNVDAPIATLSGGQRQVVAIARAMYFGARVLILDEPTAALGVKQSGMVLKFIQQAAKSGVAVVFITHNPHHAYLVGDRFTLLNMGRQALQATRDEVTLEMLTLEMAGGQALQEEMQAVVAHELDR